MTSESSRPPIRDSCVLNLVKQKVAGKLSPDYLLPVDIKYSRAFSWFPNAAVPHLLQPFLTAYLAWTASFLADSRDTIFVTHCIFSLLTIVPSALFLLSNFTWLHAILHTVLMVATLPPFILMLHCTCHRRASLWTDITIHYVIAPFYGEIWNTFYFHHVKHHHIEDNGPLDLSSTIWYDRDELSHFIHYFSRFVFLVGFELPLYFWKKGKKVWAVHAAIGEWGTIAFYASWFLVADWRSVVFAWYLPMFVARYAVKTSKVRIARMMSGNWTQHSFLDQSDATNDYKTALTVINSPYNALAFNDGYHTSHHLNALRHWQDHPDHFIANLEKFREKNVVIFQGIDYWGIFVMLMMKNYDVLAFHYVDLTGKMTIEEKKLWLKARTRKLTPEELTKNYPAAEVKKEL